MKLLGDYLGRNYTVSPLIWWLNGLISSSSLIVHILHLKYFPVYNFFFSLLPYLIDIFIKFLKRKTC